MFALSSEYLDDAVHRNSEMPERFTAFRSSVRWVRAHAANARHGTLKIYFAPIGGEKGVEYIAMLHQVHLDPNPDNSVTKGVLACELDSTREEGLWEQTGQKVQTLYTISHCKRLETPFPMTRLTKAADGQPISANYGYSYSIVREEIDMPGGFEVHPGEVSDPVRYPEGATRRVSVNVYERSSAARAECIAHYGHACIVCGFDFHAIYGTLGEGFIHVHHIKPLSEVDEQYEVDPVEDLRPVCPNCHAMMHRADPPVSVENLRAIMKKRE